MLLAILKKNKQLNEWTNEPKKKFHLSCELNKLSSKYVPC